MSATAGYKGDIYIVDDSIAFSTAFSAEATTESGVTRQYQIDDTDKRVWDRNQAVSVAGYWAFQEFGLSTTSGASSGLSTTTQYYFKIAIDGGAVTEYDITTAGDVTWSAVVTLIDTAISGAGATCEFIDGDVRIHSDDTTASSDISCSAGTTGTSLFGQGNVPAVGSLETVDYTDIVIDTTNFGNHGIKYGTGTVQMSHTGFTSLTVTGYYHTLKQAGQFTDYNLTVNCNAVDITDFQSTWKKNYPTTKNFTCSLNGIYNDEQYFDLQANGTVIIKLYLETTTPQGFYLYGAISNTLSVTPHEVIREALNVEGDGNAEYFNS